LPGNVIAPPGGNLIPSFGPNWIPLPGGKLMPSRGAGVDGCAGAAERTTPDV
jgi:hypothetical protein